MPRTHNKRCFTGQDDGFSDSCRGYLGALSPVVLQAGDGNATRTGFGCAAHPASTSASLWRQARLSTRQGLFEVVPGIYQVRGLDLCNMTLVEGCDGVIVIDPLISTECAATALALYRAHRGERPVSAVIYTHGHADHCAGVRGVTGGGVPVIAARGFAQNVLAGPAMMRRSLADPAGLAGLIAPTVDITVTGQEEKADGVWMIFQTGPGAEMNFFFPDQGVLCLAENAAHVVHDAVTPHGALMHDPRTWARYLTETIGLFADRSEAVFGSHHWPTWGQDRVLAFLSGQRDMYAYLHDQSVRLIRQGYPGTEITQALALPPVLDAQWNARGQHGSFSRYVQALYQRYTGWVDGPWEHTPVQASRRYLEYMGGADAVLAMASQSLAGGDPRWTVQVLTHVLHGDPSCARARELRAVALELLGYDALAWPDPLAVPDSPAAPDRLTADLLATLSSGQLFDALAIRLDGPRAAATRLVLGCEFTDRSESWTLLLSNGVLTAIAGPAPAGEPPVLMLSLGRPVLDAVLTGATLVQDEVAAGRIVLGGDPAAFTTLLALLDAP